ncbi:MAG TPA: hypothetical protein P5067_07970 [Candidatus Marinimicrobia bacterium]|nr:hypothetical protein [Candidatus Neomarinimicrobiota bacterium]HRS52349.1 hypothetical protein [Candidatus Neomarinimicrobiota bacterium]
MSIRLVAGNWEKSPFDELSESLFIRLRVTDFVTLSSSKREFIEA